MNDIKRIEELAGHRKIKLMEVCGGHTSTIMKYGIRDLLPQNIQLISGPGCPVCVSPQHDIDCMIELAKHVPIATYGDMIKVPGTNGSLEHARANGARIYEVYSAEECLGLADDLVFFGIGFETTAPMSAYLLKKGITVYSVHKLVAPAISMLAGRGIDGFIDPGHVSVITGLEPYRKIKAAQVVTGFEPEEVIRGIRLLLELIMEGKKDVLNAYPEAVKEKGNKKIQAVLDENFKVVDSEWRGLGIVESSGLEVKDNKLNAKVIYKDVLAKVEKPKPTCCRCGEVLVGEIKPEECRLFGKSCSPEEPLGPCMVSQEGACAIHYTYTR